MGNLTVLQTTGIPIGIDPAPFWANLYLSKHECGFLGKLLKMALQEVKSFMGLFDLLMILVHLMGEEKFKSHKNKFTLRNWY